MLPPPVSEAIMSLDEVETASQARKSEATGNVAKYSAKDKATARHHAAAPKAAMTAEKMQWIDNKRTEAKARQAARQIQSQQAGGADTAVVELTSTETKACILARIRANFSALLAVKTKEIGEVRPQMDSPKPKKVSRSEPAAKKG